MKLGFWNRLAVVIAALVLAIAPVAFQLDAAIRARNAQDARFETCKTLAEELPDFEEQIAERRKCLEEHLRADPTEGIWTWETWREVAIVMAVLCVIAYALIYAAQWVVRWVWAGRSPKNTE